MGATERVVDSSHVSLKQSKKERTSKEPSGTSKRAKTAKSGQQGDCQKDGSLDTLFMGGTRSVLDSSNIRVPNGINEKKLLFQRSCQERQEH